MLTYMAREIKAIDRRIIVMLFRKEPSTRPPIVIPVFCEDLKRTIREDGITVRTIFSMTDVYTAAFTLNIFVAQVADFAYPKTGTVKQTEHSLLLKIGYGFDKIVGIFLRGNIR
jgi:hypothetical protein